MYSITFYILNNQCRLERTLGQCSFVSLPLGAAVQLVDEVEFDQFVGAPTGVVVEHGAGAAARAAGVGPNELVHPLGRHYRPIGCSGFLP